MSHQGRFGSAPLWAALVTTIACLGTAAQGEEAAPENLTAKFFYFDSGRVEWAVSAEPERLERHFEANPDSARMFQSVAEAVAAAPDTEQVRTHMARWLADERTRADAPGGNVVRLRKAEGIVAYLRSHDFRSDELVEELLERSGASGVELVAVHLVDRSGVSSFQLKVVLADEQLGIGGQGFNVAFTSPEVSYTSVAYALALALYEVHEVINAEPTSGTDEDRLPGVEIEPLPPPAPLLSPDEEDVTSRTTR